jgi:glycosyltransferase involved in cell wall biosynthesis
MKIALLTSDNREIQRKYVGDAPTFGTAPKALMQGFAGLPYVEVHVLSCTQQSMKSPAMLAENIHFHSLQVPKIGWMRTGYQGCIRAVRRKLREIQPDIVHGQGTERDCAISAVLSGYPNVVTIHGKMTEIAEINSVGIGSFYWCAAKLENFTLSRANGIICISSYVENLAKRYGVSLWLIPNALQRMFFDSPRVSQERETPLLINVGVVSVRKRQRQVLPVLCALREESIDFETIFVGDSDPSSAYATRFQSELAAAQAALGKFSYIQRLGNEEFCKLFDTSSAMVHFSAEESFGLVFGEALTRNLPLFASDVGSIHDIAEGVSGVQIFNLNDWDGLKNALRRWLQSDAFRLPKAAASPEALVRRYHPTEVARQHLQVYREILDRQGKAAV